MTDNLPPLARDRKSALLGGVLSGLARWLDWDVTMVRIVFVLCSILSAAFPGLLIYLVMWVLMPSGNGDRKKPAACRSPHAGVKAPIRR